MSHRYHFRRKHLKPLLDAGLIRMTNPGNPRAPNQIWTPPFVPEVPARPNMGSDHTDQV